MIIRRRARALRRRLLESTGGVGTLEDLLRTAAKDAGLRCVALPKADPLLDGGEACLDLDMKAVWYRNDVEQWRQWFYQAHELAHFHLHQASFVCTSTDIDPDAPEEDVPADRVAAYSPRERMEREANIFAREFLLPAEDLKRAFVEEGRGASAVAVATMLPEGLVMHQLSRALLAIEAPLEEVQVEEEHEPPSKGLDPSQTTAAYWPEGPVLVEAGPGTGKTRTLVARLERLLTRGLVEDGAPADPVPARSILALTFSNKAAEEMRLRLAQACPEKATEVWMGTFHAFGLELLSRYGPWPKPEIVDPVQSLAILESLLPELELNHFRNLAKPAEPLTEVLDAISRAKDETCGPDRFRSLAKKMYDEAQQAVADAATEKLRAEAEKRRTKAEQALEVAGIYAKYQAYLRAQEAYDFGDLICEAVRLLQGDRKVLEDVQAQYRHVLVDEVQDVNHASTVFLDLLAGDGKGLWMVGDERQAIYRFRGASTAGIRAYAERMQVLALEKNYRSQQPVIDVFSAFAPHMHAGRPGGFTKWTANRPVTNARVQMEIAGSPDAEGAGLAREILGRERQYRESNGVQGMRFRDQAVLCRTNNQLADIADRLEKAGVPTLFLGNFFERSEVADLLALLELSCERGGRGLFRVARFPEYDVAVEDVRALQAFAREREVIFPAALVLVEEAEGVSAEGKRKLALLREHLGELHPGMSPWGFLCRYLFNGSGYLKAVLGDESVATQQARVALYQLLAFAYSFGRDPSHAYHDVRWAFLQHIRRMIVRNDDRGLWQVPEWAAGVDAVRLMTIHASKGLEFEAVYLPLLGKGLFPMSWRGDRRPVPEGLLAGDPKDEHTEEEDCLFFVACSRARDVLCLTRALSGYGYRSGKPTRSNPSDVLAPLAPVLPHPPDGAVTWPGDPPVPGTPDAVPVPEMVPEFSAGELDDYLFCPRKYFYEYVVTASKGMESSPYLKLHGCVRTVLHWLLDQLQDGHAVDASAALARLQERWEEQGPADDAYAVHYLKEAQQMVARAVERAAGPGVRGERPEWTVERPHGRIRVKPDQVEIRRSEEGPVAAVQRWKTGGISSTEKKRPLYALLQEGARTTYAAGRFRLEVRSLLDDAAEELSPSSDQLAEYDAAMQGILRGDFHPNRDSYQCPHCPYFFICPVG